MYKLTVTYTPGYSEIGTCETFEELSAAIDKAVAASGFVRYEVVPAGDVTGQDEGTGADLRGGDQP